MSQQRIITIAFLQPGPNNPLFNKLVAQVSEFPICHVELVFEDSMSFSIFSDTDLFFRQRSFANPDYILISLSVSPTEYFATYKFCSNAAQQNIKFSNIAMVAAYFQPRACPCLNTTPSQHLGYTFCSKIIVEALQFGGVAEVDDLTPCVTTPSSLYAAIKGSPRCLINLVPFKHEKLMHCGVMFNKMTK
jgi:hypothetical protein